VLPFSGRRIATRDAPWSLYRRKDHAFVVVIRRLNFAIDEIKMALGLFRCGRQESPRRKNAACGRQRPAKPFFQMAQFD
jgi:hypothetical protein